MSGVKRTRIRPPRKNLAGEIDFQSAWNVLSSAIREIEKKNASKLSFEQLYRTAYSLVLRKHGKQLYDAVLQQIATHLLEVRQEQLVPLLPLLPGFTGSSGSSGIANSISISTSTSTSASASAPVLSDPCGQFLRTLRQIWEDHTVSMRMVSDVLMYLDRAYCREQRIPLIYDAALGVFRDKLLREDNSAVLSAITRVVVAEITRDRDGEIVDKLLIKAVVNMIESLPEDNATAETVYAGAFEAPFLAESISYYTARAAALLEIADAAGYFWRIQDWLRAEEDRAALFLPEETFTKLTQQLETVLVAHNAQRVLELKSRGLSFLVSNSKIEDIKLIYTLLHRVDPHGKVLGYQLAALIRASGSEITAACRQAISDQRSSNGSNGSKSSNKRDKRSGNSPTAAAISWVSQILQLRAHYDRIYQECFPRDQDLLASIEKPFAEVVNDNEKVAEYLSLFIDEHMKKGFKDKTEEEIEAVLQQAIVLFRFIADKDLFERYYKNHLARRLITGKTVSEDAERAMIGKINLEVGTAFTSKLEAMFKDLKVSADLTEEFKQFQISQGASQQSAEGLESVQPSSKPSKPSKSNSKPVDLHIDVLTSNFWPMAVPQDAKQVIYPPELEFVRQKFSNFYGSRHSGRVLTFAPNHGSVDVKMAFKRRTHEVNMAVYAYIIMSQFADIPVEKPLTVEEIEAATQIPRPDLVRHLQSLAVAPRTRLLIKEPKSKDIRPGDKFYFNYGFESPTVKVKVLTISSASSAAATQAAQAAQTAHPSSGGGVAANGTARLEEEAERQNTLAEVQQARNFETDAAIVRVMKSRKELRHNDLMGEVIRMLNTRFKPSPSMIKQRIQSLLEKEYLERDANDRSLYRYLA